MVPHYAKYTKDYVDLDSENVALVYAKSYIEHVLGRSRLHK